MSPEAPHTAPVSRDPLARFAEEQNWISPDLETSVQGAITSAVDTLGGEPLRNFLYGTWMHAPLHASLTDIPVGAWTVVVACDALGAITEQRFFNSAADAANIVGLTGASLAAVAGLNDWSGIEKSAPRRIGFIHGMLNMAAAGLFLGSCVARRRRNRTSGRALAALGYVIVGLSAHLGASLVYEHGIGVDLVPGEGR